jgi:hypothetical protein
MTVIVVQLFLLINHTYLLFFSIAVLLAAIPTSEKNNEYTEKITVIRHIYFYAYIVRSLFPFPVFFIYFFFQKIPLSPPPFPQLSQAM